MIIQSILQVGVNSTDSTEFTGPVEYPKIFSHLRLANHSIVSTRFVFLHHWHHLIEVIYHAHTNNLVPLSRLKHVEPINYIIQQNL